MFLRKPSKFHVMVVKLVNELEEVYVEASTEVVELSGLNGLKVLR